MGVCVCVCVCVYALTDFLCTDTLTNLSISRLGPSTRRRSKLRPRKIQVGVDVGVGVGVSERVRARAHTDKSPSHKLCVYAGCVREKNAHSRARTHACSHARTHTRTHAHTHTHAEMVDPISGSLVWCLFDYLDRLTHQRGCEPRELIDLVCVCVCIRACVRACVCIRA